MENFFNKVFKNSNEQTQNSEKTKNQENQINPEVQKQFDDWKQNMDLVGGSSYDGNTALKREKWLRDNYSDVDYYLYELYKKGKLKPENIISTKNTIKSFYENNDFDIHFAVGSKKTTTKRIGFYKEQHVKSNRELIIDAIKEGKLDSFDEKKIKKILNNDKMYNYILEHTKKKKEHLQKQEQEISRKLSEFKESGKDKDPIMASDINFSILDIHGNDSNSETPAILELQSKLPENLSKLTINVGQIEGTNSKDEFNDENYNEGGFFDIADTSGYLPPKALESIIQRDKKSAIVMYGGHLKLCFSSAFKQILDASFSNSPEALDIHVPLDMCYDSADRITDNKKLPIIPDDNSQFELYKDQEILSVGSGVKDENPRSRIYLWSNSLEMLEAINTQNRLDTVRNQINTTEQ
ncbi:MAG TPA: hypothetical protein PKL13_02135 [bacterium]|nr:hypothetical protein [bacterium]